MTAAPAPAGRRRRRRRGRRVRGFAKRSCTQGGLVQLWIVAQAFERQTRQLGCGRGDGLDGVRLATPKLTQPFRTLRPARGAFLRRLQPPRRPGVQYAGGLVDEGLRGDCQRKGVVGAFADLAQASSRPAGWSPYAASAADRAWARNAAGSTIWHRRRCASLPCGDLPCRAAYNLR